MSKIEKPDHQVGKWHMTSIVIPLRSPGSIKANQGAQFLAAHLDGDDNVVVSFLDPQPLIRDGRTDFGGDYIASARQVTYKFTIARDGDDVPWQSLTTIGSFRAHHKTFVVFVDAIDN